MTKMHRCLRYLASKHRPPLLLFRDTQKGKPSRAGELQMTDNIPLTDAAKRLSISWERAWRALMNPPKPGAIDD